MELWQARKANSSKDFAIGPGDEITVSVPEVEELQRQKVRVSADGTIGLSLIGTMKVAGMDEEQLKAAIVRRLSDFMKYPRVDLFVESYQTREVAVTGAVQKPGRYDLPNRDESILDMIGRAGGMTSDSAQRVIFVPAELNRQSAENNGSTRSLPRMSHDAPGAGAFRPAAFEDEPPSPLGDTSAEPELNGRRWVVINLAHRQANACLDLPTRPGDIIVIPIAGEVMVQGWVKSPGAFRITPNMTVLGAVSAAGGAVFSDSVEVLRSDSTGKHVATHFDLSELEKGEQADAQVQSGDVVVVERTVAGAIPFALLQIFNRFGTGMYFPIP
ncbi:MAG TPA: polysaccharide biosynthesis/export family protein [Candidatus Binataceae bacterium]|nr:polysaccharide biosynthesis/export family protein [Candidatus Binataceae bacterium]